MYNEGIRMQKKASNNKNYIFYVSEMEEVPANGHFRKMDGGREIARHIAGGLDNSCLMKYTEYDGGMIDGDSVGIVFPTHIWGVSLAVYTFLKHLRIAKDTYVYAVAIGENLSGNAAATLGKTISSIERFKKIFMDRGFGCEDDIYIRCIDYARDYDTTEDCLRNNRDSRTRLEGIMEGLLLYPSSKLINRDIENNKNVEIELYVDTSAIERLNKKDKIKLSFSNIYLDDNIMQGVRLCRVM